MPIEVGLVGELSMTVLDTDTARASGSADASLQPVFATPRMISYMERTSHILIQPLLSPGQSSVGTVVNIRHMAATPVGMTVRFRAEVTGVDRRRITFKVEAWDEIEKIGEGEHERFIIDLDRFTERLEKKQKGEK